MSKKTELKADLDRIGYELGGGHLTRQARGSTFKIFARVMRELGYGIQAANQIGVRHLQAFAQQRVAQGIEARTIANEMSHLRAVLKRIGSRVWRAMPLTAIKRWGWAAAAVSAPSSRCQMRTFKRFRSGW